MCLYTNWNEDLFHHCKVDVHQIFFVDPFYYYLLRPLHYFFLKVIIHRCDQWVKHPHDNGVDARAAVGCRVLGLVGCGGKCSGLVVKSHRVPRRGSRKCLSKP